MATVYKVLGQSNPAATTANTVYTVPAGNSAVVSTLNICNLNSSAAAFRIAVRPGGATLANVHYLAYDVAVPGNNTISYTIGMSLAATDAITVYANSALVSFSVFGTEIY
jgi:hypothetical protein